MWEYLYGVPQEPEADIIVGLLNDHGIPAVKRYPGPGEFLKAAYGITTGVDIYVPHDLHQEALRLIKDNDLKPEINGTLERTLEEGTAKNEINYSASDNTSTTKAMSPRNVALAIGIIIVLFIFIVKRDVLF
ncbi:MAG: DUF2007 domain-containing protein [Desulfitobacterium hafniense]|nr:DUF2007 domain-containing protein [Desulfitobacterium hafniense]